MTIKTKETKDFGDVIISSAFECGSGVSFQRLNINHLGIRIPADPPNPAGGDYRWYFCVRLSNLSDTLVHLTLDAQRPGSSDTDGTASQVPVFVSEDFETWQLLSGAQMTPKYDYRLPITLNSGQAIYISNSLPHRYDTMCDWLRQIQTTHSGISRVASIGQSVQGRDIILLTISETPDTIYTENDRILITSGTHPAEPDWLATTSIIEELLSDESWARDARQKYIFDVIPQLNPDGFVLGTNGCNANGINPYWNFRPYDYKNIPETAYLWKWIETHPPAIYLDFHCYVYQINKDYQPYLKPISDYHHPAIRRIVTELDNRLLMLSQERAMRGELTNLPSTLAYQITAKYDTITYTKYHLHLKHGIGHCRNLGLSVLKTIIEGIEPYKKISDLQNERRTRNLKWLIRTSLRKVYIIIGRIYYTPKNIRNKLPKMLSDIVKLISRVWKYKVSSKKIRKISKQNIELNNEYVTRVKTYKNYKEYVHNQMEKSLSSETIEMCKRIRKERIDEFYKIFKKSLKLVNDKNHALCIGARYGEEAEAAKKIFNKVEAIDLVEYPPLVKTGDMHNLEFPNHTFDLIYTNALDHSFNPHKAIEECYRVLKPKGILIVDIKYKDKGRYEVIRFDDEITFKKMFSRHFKLVKEENINNSEVLFGLSNRYFWRKK